MIMCVDAVTNIKFRRGCARDCVWLWTIYELITYIIIYFVKKSRSFFFFSYVPRSLLSPLGGNNSSSFSCCTVGMYNMEIKAQNWCSLLRKRVDDRTDRSMDSSQLKHGFPESPPWRRTCWANDNTNTRMVTTSNLFTILLVVLVDHKSFKNFILIGHKFDIDIWLDK